MNSKINHRLLALVALGWASTACSGAMEEPTTDEATATAQSLLTYQQEERLGSVPLNLEGDADLWTQNGRTTSWAFSAWFLRLDPGNVAVYWINLDLQEDYRPDHTHLAYYGELYSQLPWYWNIQDIRCSYYATSGVITNKQRDFKLVYQDPHPTTTPNCFASLSIKADDEGPDDTGNAQAKIVFSPTITYN